MHHNWNNNTRCISRIENFCIFESTEIKARVVAFIKRLLVLINVITAHMVTHPERFYKASFLLGLCIAIVGFLGGQLNPFYSVRQTFYGSEKKTSRQVRRD